MAKLTQKNIDRIVVILQLRKIRFNYSKYPKMMLKNCNFLRGKRVFDQTS